MQDQISELDLLQQAYKAAVEQWIDAIRQEEALASVNREDELRSKVKAAKTLYEDALRQKYFNF
jgi:hypothetical protein